MSTEVWCLGRHPGKSRYRAAPPQPPRTTRQRAALTRNARVAAPCSDARRMTHQWRAKHPTESVVYFKILCFRTYSGCHEEPRTHGEALFASRTDDSLHRVGVVHVAIYVLHVASREDDHPRSPPRRCAAFSSRFFPCTPLACASHALHANVQSVNIKPGFFLHSPCTYTHQTTRRVSHVTSHRVDGNNVKYHRRTRCHTHRVGPSSTRVVFVLTSGRGGGRRRSIPPKRSSVNPLCRCPFRSFEHRTPRVHRLRINLLRAPWYECH